MVSVSSIIAGDIGDSDCGALYPASHVRPPEHSASMAWSEICEVEVSQLARQTPQTARIEEYIVYLSKGNVTNRRIDRTRSLTNAISRNHPVAVLCPFR